MAVPEIPARDVAKLVLGYLAEEQLMTAYDEFLASSPYLDAMDNEYDRIFMTSLKHIAAEYRALRITIENTHPVMLRRQLLQLPNLLEMVKYLIKNVNLQKLNLVNNIPLPQNPHSSLRENEYDKFRHKKSLNDCQRDVCPNQIPARMQSSHHTNNVETTSLADLPGNNQKSKKQIRVLEKNTTAVSPFNIARERELERLKPQSLSPTEHNKSHLDGSVQNACSLSLRPHNKLESRHSSEQNSSTTAGESSQNVNPERLNAGTFQEFASGVGAGTQVIENIPDSSTTENVISVKNIEGKQQSTYKGKKSQYLIQLSTPNGLITNDKIKIISDVKVNDSSKLKAFNNAASGIKAIVVNGKPTQEQILTYTKEEIMAMPTVILYPASGPPPTSAPQPITIQPLCGAGDVSASSGGTLGPLTIDVAADSPGPSGPTAPLVNTCDVKAIVQSSVPKDSVVSIVGKTSTPQVLPPTRKSSSTPRRTSHVRVLDFATPRRILEGTIQEHPQKEILLSRSPSLIINDGKSSEDDAKENKPIPQTSKSKNWDADLRALVGNSQDASKTPKAKSKPRSTRKKKASETVTETPKTDKKKIAKKALSLKASAKKSRKKSEEHSHESIKEVASDVVVVPEVAVKPTINIITEWTASPPKEDKSAETSDNKSSEVQSDTPETDRLSLHNAIGAKLNISDLLQTPYKQALYEIQMDTPAFLRPDIPCSEPVSEIKITDFPTPRFLNTPGSRGSRPTDYSSGGSYYRPDDDALLPPELDLEPYAAPATSDAPAAPVDDAPDAHDVHDARAHRPQRKCAQNVSYCDSKAKTIETKDDLNSSIDTTILDVTGESNVDTKSNNSAIKDTKTKTKESKRKSTSVRNRKSSKKATPNKFMKIKPRRPTPVKLNRSKTKKDSGKSQNDPKRKRTSSKEKSVTPAPTKSRRKSSTPRKLHTKVFSTESLDTNSSESINRGKEMNKITAPSVDSDTETLRLRWPEDCSRGSGANNNSANDIEDINKIQEFIESTGNSVCPTPMAIEDESSSLHIDLVKRGFDSDTARRIERDLLDAGPGNSPRGSANVVPFKDISIPSGTVTKTAENDVGTSGEINDNSNNEEIEFRSVQECNNESFNYFGCKHDTQRDESESEKVRIKDGYSVEICIDDDEVIRIQATAFTDLLEEQPYLDSSSYVETEAAVSSIANIDRLYTPLKDQRTLIEEQCIEIFDSTLTSLDTPLKANSPKRKDVSITELIEITIEKEDPKDKSSKKRKRVQSSPEVVPDNKKNKKEARFIPDIQNIDIESVLSKLHP